MLSSGVSRLFLDTALVIYFVERNPQFVDLVDQVYICGKLVEKLKYFSTK
ncbi:MAG: hypothetical protein V7K64_02835 [Nostoc sp.]